MFTNPVSNAAQAGFALTHALLFRSIIVKETNRKRRVHSKYVQVDNIYRVSMSI